MYRRKKRDGCAKEPQQINIIIFLLQADQNHVARTFFKMIMLWQQQINFLSYNTLAKATLL